MGGMGRTTPEARAEAQADGCEFTEFTIGEVRGRRREGRIELTGPRREGPPVELEASVEALRRHVRFDDRGRYRPLSGARTLPTGWRIDLPASLTEAAIEAIYPQTQIHRRQAREGALRVVAFEEVVARQRGRYRPAGELDGAGLAHVREALCGRCVRAPAWAGDAPATASIPCPEPCSPLLALAREAALWRRRPVAPAPVDPDIAFADFAAAGNEVREACLALSRTDGAGGAGVRRG